MQSILAGGTTPITLRPQAPLLDPSNGYPEIKTHLSGFYKGAIEEFHDVQYFLARIMYRSSGA
jgi:hypothetical protein